APRPSRHYAGQLPGTCQLFGHHRYPLNRDAMSKYVAIILSLFISRQGVAQIQAQESGSTVQFKIRNLGFNVNGSLGGIAGKIQFDPAKPEEATFHVTVDAGTIN